MHGHLRYATTTLLCTLIAASTAVAQDATNDTTKAAAKPPCDAGLTPTPALSKATFSLDRAFRGINIKKDETGDLKDAIRDLTTPPGPKDPKVVSDSAGRAYYLGQAYILMLQQPKVRPIGPRSDYGIATDPAAKIDLLAAADTEFTKAQAGLPACKSEIAKWRQQKPWLDALNYAIMAINAGQLDTAAVLAKRSLLIDRSTPYAYSILGNAARNRKDYAAATEYFKQALAVAETDTAYNDARLSAIFDLANNSTKLAEATTDSSKKTLVQQAIAAWHNFIPIGTQDVQTANAELLIAQLYTSIGDSSNTSDAYSQVMPSMSKFGEQTLLNAGVIAMRARKPEDATKFFSAVLDENPYQRDALNDLAASYTGGGNNQPDKMFPLIDRLVAIDPNNPENWRLYAFAYNGLLKGTKDHKLIKAYTDSLEKYSSKADSMKTVVSLTEFSHTKNATTLGGAVENLAATNQSYVMQIDFLDKTGTVVGTQTVNVGPVPPKGTVTFTATVPTPKAAAFRYKPLS